MPSTPRPDPEFRVGDRVRVDTDNGRQGVGTVTNVEWDFDQYMYFVSGFDYEDWDEEYDEDLDEYLERLRLLPYALYRCDLTLLARDGEPLPMPSTKDTPRKGITQFWLKEGI